MPTEDTLESIGEVGRDTDGNVASENTVGGYLVASEVEDLEFDRCLRE